MPAGDGDALELVLGVVAELLHRVPADPALGDVAMHVIGKAQVFIHGDAVAGGARLAGPACADGRYACWGTGVSTWPYLPTVGVEDVACGVELKLGIGHITQTIFYYRKIFFIDFKSATMFLVATNIKQHTEDH